MKQNMGKKQLIIVTVISLLIGGIIGSGVTYLFNIPADKQAISKEKTSSESSLVTTGEDKSGLIQGKYQVGTTIKPGSYTIKVVKADTEVGGGITLSNKMDNDPRKEGEDVIVGAKVGDSAHVELKSGQVLDLWDDSSLVVDLKADK